MAELCWKFLILIIILVHGGLCVLANSLSCYQCKSSEENYSVLCANNVGGTTKYAKECPGEEKGCYAMITSPTDVIRGCLNKMNELTEENRPFVSICQGSLCNNWESQQESYLMCSFCKGDECLTGREETKRCPIVTLPGANVYCFTRFSISSGRAIERGCMDDRPTNMPDTFAIPCPNDNCNGPQELDKISCNSFKGLKTQFKDNFVICNKNLKSHIPGCFSFERGAEVEMGCNSQLPADEFSTLFQWDMSIMQFCFEDKCNSMRVNLCKKMKKEDPIIDMETCKDVNTRCFIKSDPSAIHKFISGCVPDYFFLYNDPDVRFCSNNETNVEFPCNVKYPTELACHVCSGPRCRDSLGNIFKQTCPVSATSCYTAQDYDHNIERGCWIPEVTKSEMCEEFEHLCVRCSESYCNDEPANAEAPRCDGTDGFEHCVANPIDPYEEEGFVYEGHEQDLSWNDESGSLLLKQADPKFQGALPVVEEFSCYQCHSQDIFDQSCDEDVRYLKPKPCAYLYGSRPTSCYILVHRGWTSLERGCGSSLDKFTYASCDSDLFAECKICATSGCNNVDMRNMVTKVNATKNAWTLRLKDGSVPAP